MAPGRLLQTLWSKCRNLWTNIMGADPKSFWDSVPADDPKLSMLEELMSDDPTWRQHTWPLVLHGDGAKFSNNKSESLGSVQIKSLISEGWSLPILSLWCVVKGACTEDTRNTLWHVTVNHLNALFRGMHPELDIGGLPFYRSSPDYDVAGTALCDGKKFVVWNICGDLDWLANSVGYPHFNSNHICWFCAVARTPGALFPMTDLSRGARWKDTLLSEDDLLMPCTEHHC